LFTGTLSSEFAKKSALPLESYFESKKFKISIYSLPTSNFGLLSSKAQNGDKIRHNG